jgi:hypothetical protein
MDALIWLGHRGLLGILKDRFLWFSVNRHLGTRFARSRQDAGATSDGADGFSYLI